RHLRLRVDSGIRASRSRNMHMKAFDAANDFFKDALNGRQPRLHLPPMEFGAVVSESDLDPPAQLIVPRHRRAPRKRTMVAQASACGLTFGNHRLKPVPPS